MVRPKGYDIDGYIHFVEKRTGGTHWIGKENTREMPDTEMYEVDFEYIENLNLNKIGNEILYTNSVWNVDRYMAYYWKPIIGADSIFVWHQLWEYCDKDSPVDMCYPKMKELAQRCGLAKSTLIDKLKKLEDNNFLIKIGRLNKRNGNKEDSPIFKLRRTIPLLSRVQVETLNPYLQMKHKEYMDNWASGTNLEWFRFEGSKTIDDIIGKVGDRIISRKTRDKIDSIIKNEHEEEYILVNLPPHMMDTLKKNDSLKNILSDGYFSKPMTDVYFKDTMVVYEPSSRTAHFICREKTQKDFLEDTLTDLQKDKLMKCLMELYENVYDIKFFTTEQYIVSMLKAK